MKKLSFKDWLATKPHTFSKIKTIGELVDCSENTKRRLHQEYLIWKEDNE